MQPKQEFEELMDVKAIIDNQNFHKYICRQMEDYRRKQRNNFFSDSVKESWRKGGRCEAIKFFFDILKNIEVDFHNKRDELEAEQNSTT